MSTNEHSSGAEAGGFAQFFRNYTKTWIHAVATAGLTALGTLTFVHRWFVVLALASYVVPPIVLYVRWRRREEALASVPDESTGRRTETRDERRTEQRPTARDEARPPEESRLTRDAEPEPELDRDQRGTRDRAGGGRTGEQAGEPRHEREADRQVTPSPSPSPSSSSSSSSSPSADREPMAESAASESDTRDADGERGGEESGDRDTGDAADEPATDRGATESGPDRWIPASAPTEATLHDVTVAETGRGYAVGDGGVVIAGRDEWAVVLETGPGAGGNDLFGVDATDDGTAVWVAGNSGALGRIDADSGRHTDYTAPTGITDNWLGIAVGGGADEETVLLINGSGAVLRGRYRDGDVDWTDPVTPGSGSSLSGVDLADETTGYCCDTNDGVFETTDGGESFSRIGIDGADGTLTDVAAGPRADPSPVLVSGDDGVVHRYDDSTWTPERVAAAALSGIARGDDRALVCGDDGSIHERDAETASWTAVGDDGAGEFDADELDSLLAVSIGAGRAVAVGANGTVLERG